MLADAGSDGDGGVGCRRRGCWLVWLIWAQLSVSCFAFGACLSVSLHSHALDCYNRNTVGQAIATCMYVCVPAAVML